jgi:hypothetical protein
MSELDWLSVALGWAGGVPSGLAANWLFHRYLRAQRRRGDYFSTSIAEGRMEFEGRIPWGEGAKRLVIETEQVMGEVLGQLGEHGQDLPVHGRGVTEG